MSLCGAGGPGRQLCRTSTGTARRALPAMPGWGGRGLRGAAGPPSHRHPLLRRARKPSLQELSTHGTAPSGEPSVGLLLRVSTNWGFYLPCFHAYSSSSHLRGRRWLFKGERNAKPSPREARAPGRGHAGEGGARGLRGFSPEVM